MVRAHTRPRAQLGKLNPLPLSLRKLGDVDKLCERELIGRRMSPRHLRTAQGGEFTMLLIEPLGVVKATFDEPSTLHDLSFESPNSTDGDDDARVFASIYSGDWVLEALKDAPPNTVLGVLSCFIDGTVRQSSGAKRRFSVANGTRPGHGHTGPGPASVRLALGSCCVHCWHVKCGG